VSTPKTNLVLEFMIDFASLFASPYPRRAIERRYSPAMMSIMLAKAGECNLLDQFFDLNFVEIFPHVSAVRSAGISHW